MAPIKCFKNVHFWSKMVKIGVFRRKMDFLVRKFENSF